MIKTQKPICRPEAGHEPQRPHRRRNGVTMVELVISAMLLVTVMTFVTSLSYSINLVWKDIGHYRIATGELSNQLENLTRLSRQEAQERVASLRPSEFSARTLREPVLDGQLVEDNLGTRVVLKLNWKRRNPGPPVELAGWLSQNRFVDTPSKSGTDQ